MSETIWKPVVGWEGRYEVSNTGYVRNVITGRLLARTDSKYLFVALTGDGRRCTRMVHLLVAEAFIGPKPFATAVVAHLDDDPHNCHVSNLKYVAGRVNTEMARAHGLFVQGTDHHNSLLSEYDIVEIRESKESNRALARRFGTSPSTISRIRSGITHKRGPGMIRL